MYATVGIEAYHSRLRACILQFLEQNQELLGPGEKADSLRTRQISFHMANSALGSIDQALEQREVFQVPLPSGPIAPY